MKIRTILSKRKIPASAWVALAVVGAAAVLLRWAPDERPIPTAPGEQALAWHEVEDAPLTTPDSDPLPPGAIVRLGRERFRQGSGPPLLAFSPDGKILASVEPPRLEWPGKHAIHLWQVTTGKEVRRLESPPEDYVFNLRFSADAKRLSLLGIVRSADNRLSTWILTVLDVETGKEVHRLKGLPRENPMVVMSPDSKMLAWTGNPNFSIHLCDATTGQEVGLLTEHESVQPVRFTADGKTLIGASSSNKVIYFWDVTTGAEVQRLSLSNPGSIAFSGDGKELLVCRSDGPMRCWDVTSGREVRQIDNPFPGRSGASTLSPDGKIAAAGYSDGTIRWWDTATGGLGHAVQAHLKRFGALTFSEDGKVLASQQAGEDGAIQLWDVATGDKLSPREGHQAGIVSLSLAPDGRSVATVADDHTLRIWNIATGQELRRVRTMGEAVAFSPTGAMVAMSGNGEIRQRPGTVWLLDPATGGTLRGLAGDHVFPFRSLVFSPDGSKLYGGGQDNCLWDVATGKVLREFSGSEFRPAAFSPDGTILAVGGGDISSETIELWNLVGDQLLRRFGPGFKPTEDWRAFSSLAFSPDGKLLAAADGVEHGRTPRPPDGLIRIYEFATGQERLVLQGHRQLVTSIQFSPDGNVLVSGGDDRSVRLWNAATGKELHRFEGHRDSVTCVAFAPDGRTVISGSRDSTALVWDVAPFCKP